MERDAFEERLRRIAAGREVPDEPRLPQAATPAARLAKALALLQRKGVNPLDAYPPLFRALAREGVIVPPPAFWPVGLVAAAGTGLFAAIYYGFRALVVWLDLQVRAAGFFTTVDARIVIAGCVIGGLVLAGQQARHGQGLPRWRDL